MKSGFSTQWKSSKQIRKQRKYRHNAPLHIKQRFMHTHLSKDLMRKYGLRSLQLKKGDKIRIARGSFKRKEGKVERIDLKKEKVFITGIERSKKDGSKQLIPFNSSNLIILELVMDKKRKEKLERNESNGKLKEEKKEAADKKRAKEEVKEQEIKKEIGAEEVKENNKEEITE